MPPDFFNNPFLLLNYIYSKVTTMSRPEDATNIHDGADREVTELAAVYRSALVSSLPLPLQNLRPEHMAKIASYARRLAGEKLAALKANRALQEQVDGLEEEIIQLQKAIEHDPFQDISDEFQFRNNIGKRLEEFNLRPTPIAPGPLLIVELEGLSTVSGNPQRQTVRRILSASAEALTKMHPNDITGKLIRGNKFGVLLEGQTLEGGISAAIRCRSLFISMFQRHKLTQEVNIGLGIFPTDIAGQLANADTRRITINRVFAQSNAAIAHLREGSIQNGICYNQGGNFVIVSPLHPG